MRSQNQYYDDWHFKQCIGKPASIDKIGESRDWRSQAVLIADIWTLACAALVIGWQTFIFLKVRSWPLSLVHTKFNGVVAESYRQTIRLP
jgi:hypothetical protein